MNRLRPSLVGFTVLVAGALVGPTLTPAAEPPKDPGTIQRLTPEQARTLVAGFEGPYLHLGSLTSLAAATASALARLEGGGLGLTGLTILDAATAKALAAFKGWVSLAGNLRDEFVAEHPLTPQAALAYFRLFEGVLPFLAAFDSPSSVEIAKSLAACKGPLSLPNLKRISPRALSALIAKEDAELPPIETLELIAEPDGGPSDDFVIPEGFQERQIRQRAEQAARESD